MNRRWLQAWWTAPRARHLVFEGLIAVCLAFIIWLYIHSRAQQTLEHVQVPVVVRLAPHQREHYVVDVEGTPRVTASFTGSVARIRELRQKLVRGHVQVVVDYAVAGSRQQDATFCDMLRVEAARLPTPPGVTADLVEETASISITVHRVIERSLPVKLDYTGDARVTQVKLEPATVQVRGPKHLLDRAQHVVTATYVAATQADEVSDPLVKGQLNLVSDFEGRPVEVAPAQVSFQCKITPKKRIYALREVPVQFLCPAQFPWRPRFAEEQHGKVTLRLIGPTSDEAPPVLAYVDLSKGTFGRGRNLEPLRLHLPKDFHLADNTPMLVTFELEEAERVAANAVEPREPTPWKVERRSFSPWKFDLRNLAPWNAEANGLAPWDSVPLDD